MYKCSKKTQFTVIETPVLSCAIMMMIIMIKYYAYFLVIPKLLTQLMTAVCLVVVYSNIQKFTIIMIMGPITCLYLDMDLIS